MKYKIIQDILCFGKYGEILSDTEEELLNISKLLEKGILEEVKEEGKKLREDYKEEYKRILEKLIDEVTIIAFKCYNGDNTYTISLEKIKEIMNKFINKNKINIWLK